MIGAGGFRFEVEPAFAARAGPLLAALERGALPDGLPCFLVKENLGRLVHRVEIAPDLAVFVKRDRPRGLGARAKYAALPSRARAEWKNLGRLRAAGLLVPERVLFGERRGPCSLDEAVIVTRSAEPAARLWDWLAGAAREARRAALREIARIARRLHENGFFHRDFHAGNMLVRPPASPGEQARIILVDVQKVWRLPHVPARLRARDLGVLFHDLSDAIDDEDRQALLDAYGASAAFATRVLRACAARRRERLRSRGKRCLVSSSAFRVDHGKGLRIYRRADVPPEALLQAIERHRATIAAGPGAPGFVKRDHSTCVSKQPPIAAAGPIAGPVAVKEFPEKGFWARLQHALRRHRGREAWVSAHALLLRGIETPLPLGLVEVRRMGFVAGSFLVTRWIEDAEDVHAFVERRFAKDAGGAPALRREAVRALARFVARLHGEGLYHNDLKPTNFLVREARDGERFRIALLDLDALSLRKRLTARRRAKNLGQIDDYARLFFAPIGRTDRARFFDEYLRAMLPRAPRAERRKAARRMVPRIEAEVRARERRRQRKKRIENRESRIEN
jgi:tRNA A-37 threonylcarbamoyl transferase component Bud32